MSSISPPPREDRGPTLLGVQWGLFAGATVLYALRLYVRVFIRRSFGWDDFWISLSWAIALYASIVVELQVQAGFGQHGYYVERNAGAITHYTIAGELGAVWGITTVKLSVICFVLRLVGQVNNVRYIRWACFINLAIFVPITIATFVILCVQCIPLSAAWTEFSPADKCLDRKIIGDIVIAFGAASATSDLLTGIIPVLILLGLQMNKKRKYGLSVLTGLGCVISAFAIARSVEAATKYSDPDPTWALVPVAIYSAIEHSGGIITACLPTITPILGLAHTAMSNQFTRWRQSYSRSSRRSRSSPQATAERKTPVERSRQSSKASSTTEKDSLHSQSKEPLCLDVRELKSAAHDAELGIRRTIDVEVHSTSSAGQSHFDRHHFPWSHSAPG